MKAIGILHKFLYIPICRAYANMLGDNKADSFMCLLYSLHFFIVRGYWPNFNNPQSFEEKLAVRMLFDRDPIWTILSDKARVRDYVASKVDCKYLIPMFWSGNDPDKIPFHKLPSAFVIKATHGCQYNIIVKNKEKLDQKEVKKKLKKWLDENFCKKALLGVSWGYKNIIPTIIVEAFLNNNGDVPIDYKFFCFSGRVEFLQMNFDRFGDPYEKTFDRDFNPLDLWQGEKQYPGEVSKPKNYEEMLSVAEKLSVGFPFIRVDLYNIEGQIFFGELTCYPGGGMVEWIPRKYDYLLGDKWKVSYKGP